MSKSWQDPDDDGTALDRRPAPGGDGHTEVDRALPRATVLGMPAPRAPDTDPLPVLPAAGPVEPLDDAAPTVVSEVPAEVKALMARQQREREAGTQLGMPAPRLPSAKSPSAQSAQSAPSGAPAPAPALGIKAAPLGSTLPPPPAPPGPVASLPEPVAPEPLPPPPRRTMAMPSGPPIPAPPIADSAPPAAPAAASSRAAAPAPADPIPPRAAGGLPANFFAPQHTAQSRSVPAASFGDDDGFPINWGRYQELGLLGQGGMGKVWKAYDPRLQRTVAIKFVAGEASSAQAQQLLKEASAQALIEHRHICKVYEVGEVAGRPFVAMQYIDGRTFDECAPKMTLTEKLAVMERVCGAMEAAHRRGMLHRDIKPPNIMVEKDGEGNWQPFVMDFGLARDPRSKRGTAHGALLGTPNFMSPEQAKGDHALIDTRSDIYSLGATLYHVLSGVPPYVGSSAIEVIAQVLSDPPPPLRKHAPAVPADVEAIVGRAMAREREQRYPSAKAMADDIRRFLDGDPVEALAARDPGYRLRRRLRKHRVLVGIAGVAGLLLLGAGGALLRTRSRAAESARLAQHFGDLVHDIDSRLRLAYIMPAHDVRVQRREVRGRLDEIAAEMKRLGSIADGPGHYALGRGHQILDELDAAQTHLEAAWNSGYREPAVAYALGQLWYSRYEQEREDALKPSAGSKEADAADQAKTQALNFLEKSRAAGAVPSDYLEAQILALQTKRHAALDKARSAYAKDPLLFEARVLEGDVLSVQGHLAFKKGDFAEARDKYEKSEAATRAAIEAARSCPRAYFQLCRVLHRIAVLPGPYSEKAYRAAADTCRAGMKVDPDDESLAAKTGSVLAYWALEQLRHGQDPQQLDEARRAIERALELNPRRTNQARNLADAIRVQALVKSARGEDPSATFAEATAVLDKGLAADLSPHRRYTLLLGMAMLRVAAARDAVEHGREADVQLADGAKVIDEARVINPNDFRLMTLSAERHLLAARAGKGAQASGELDAAVSEAGRTLEMNHEGDDQTLVLAAAALTARATRPGAASDAALRDLGQAIDDARKATVVDSDESAGWRALAEALLARAEREKSGATADVKQAAEAIERALAINGRGAELLLVRARVAAALHDAKGAAAALDAAQAIDPHRLVNPALLAYIKRH